MKAGLTKAQLRQLETAWSGFITKIFELSEADVNRYLEGNRSFRKLFSAEDDKKICIEALDSVRENLKIIIDSPKFDPQEYAHEMRLCVSYFELFGSDLSNPQVPIDTLFANADRLRFAMNTIAAEVKASKSKTSIRLKQRY